jgi:hypothetical protein
MVSRTTLVAALLGVLLGALPARADSPKLVDARRAVEAVDYEAARRLLLEALRDGDNSPAAVGEIYRLSARAAIVLGERDLAEQYYRRWLAIDPTAALPGDTAPKLREPFVAAQAYIAAHGRLLARAERTSTGEVDVELVADPLAMARAAAALGPGRNAPVPFGGDHKAHLAAATRIAVVDDAGNRLLEVDVAPGPTGARSADGQGGARSADGQGGARSTGGQGGARSAAQGGARSADGQGGARSADGQGGARSADGQGGARSAAGAGDADTSAESRPWTRRWTTWAIPTGVFGVVTGAFGLAALTSYQQAQSDAAKSGQFHLSDAEDNVHRGRTFTWITIGGGAVTLAFAIPTAIFFLKERGLGGATPAGTTVVPTVGDSHAGLAVTGQF